MEDSGALLPALESGPESPSLSLPLPGSWAQAVLTQPPCFPNFGSEDDHLLHWKQQHNRGLLCELVPTAPSIGPQTPDLWKWLKTLRGPGSILWSKSGSSASLTTPVHAEDDADYYCFSWADGLKVCPVLQARAEADKDLLPPQPRGAQGKGSAPPFLESLRPRNPADWVSAECSPAAPSARLPSRGQRHTGGGHTPLDDGAAHTGAPGSQVGVSSTENGGQCHPCWVPGQRTHIPELPPQKHLLSKEKEMEPRVSSSNFHTVQDPVKTVTYMKNQETKY